MVRVFSAIAVLVVLLPPAAAGELPTAPLAEAGSSRYAAEDPIQLDGTGSYDPDGDAILGYEWAQVSGPEVEISDADTAKPVISGFVQTQLIQTVEVELVVSDGLLTSLADSVEVVIVPRMARETMSLVNGPFRPDLPTLITFGGGDCVDGIHMPLNAIWQERFNIITGPYFFPYLDQAYQIMVLLSALAPDYRQPIQTIGFSTGGNPASYIPIIINQFFADPRYAINRMTLLDTWCDENLDQKVAQFSRYPVADEPAWADVYRSFREPIPGALNVSFFPGGDHSTPYDWYLASAQPENWPNGDIYNQGVTGGYFVSVAGPAGNLRLATDDTSYYFECPELALGCLQPLNLELYPGLLPEPVTLIGPEDGGRAGPFGVVLKAEESRHATSYELLFGPDPANMTISVSETLDPPDIVVDEFPFTPTYWTIRVRDAIGSTIFAPPRSIYAYESNPVRRILRRATPDP